MSPSEAPRNNFFSEIILALIIGMQYVQKITKRHNNSQTDQLGPEHQVATSLQKPQNRGAKIPVPIIPSG